MILEQKKTPCCTAWKEDPKETEDVASEPYISMRGRVASAHWLTEKTNLKYTSVLFFRVMRVNVSSKERQSEQSHDRERDRLRAVPLSSCSECGTGLTTSWAEMDPWQSGAWNAHIYYVRGVACVNDMSLEYQRFH